MSELQVSSTTDTQDVVSAAAQNDADGARIPEQPMEQESLDGSTAVSYEHPRSERAMLVERLVEEHERKFSERNIHPESDVERVASNEPSEGNDTESAELQAGAPEWTRPDHPYFQKMQETYAWYGPEKIREIVQPVLEAGVDLAPGVASALAELPNGPEVLLHLCRDPWCADGLVALNEMVPKQARRVLGEWNHAVEQLEESGREAQQPVARRSNAPPPIRPIGGSSTKSSVPLDEMSYRDFCKMREQQQKARYRK